MQTASPAFAAAMLLADQEVAQRVLLNLPATDVNGNAIPSSYADVSDCVVSIKGDVAATTNVPEGSLLISGYSAAGATLVLSGPLKQAAGVPTIERQTIYWLLNPSDPTSPMFRLPRLGLTVTLQEGRWVGGNTPEWVTVGTLIVDTIACSNGTVTITLIDGRNSVRGQAYLPPVITQAPYNAGLTSEFAVDALLRGSSYLSRPAVRPGCLLSVGFRSSIWPEVGSYASFPQQPIFAEGMYGTGLDHNSTSALVYTLAGSFAPADALCGQYISSGLANLPQVNTFDSTQSYGISILVVSNVLRVFVQTPSGTVSAVAAIFVSGMVEWSISWPAGSTSVTGTVWVNGTANTVSITAAAVRPSNINFSLCAIDGPIEAVQLVKDPSFAPQGSFTPTLILDSSLNPLTALPDVANKDKWAALQDIAAAEGAVFNIDELNIAHFVNRNSIAAKTSSLTLSSRVNLTALDMLEQQSTQYTHVQVPVNAVQITAPTTVWGANQVYAVPAVGKLVLNVKTQYPVLALSADDSGFYPDSGALPGGTYWRADSQADGLGVGVTAGIHVHVDQVSATHLILTITNTNGFTAFLANPSGYAVGTPGQVSLVVGGQLVTPASASIDGVSAGSGLIADAQWPPAALGGAVSNPAGDILLALPANDWLQDLGAAQALADHYLSDFHVALPLLRNTTIVSDPRTQLLDRVTLADVDVSQASMDALIVGIHFVYGGGSGSGQFWTRTFDLRSFWPPGAWVLGVAGMSELGDGSTIQGTAYAY